MANYRRNWPTDGVGVYEGSVNGYPSAGSAVYGPRLTEIAAAGFSVVINYGLLQGTMAQITGYIDYAYALGLKCAVPLMDVRIWRDNTYAAAYATLYADLGNPGTGTLFMQGIVAGVKTHAGVYAYYLCDELLETDHATWSTYAAAVKTADATHPRLGIQAVTSTGACFSRGTTLYIDQLEIAGDDHYPYGVNRNAGGNLVDYSEPSTYLVAQGLLKNNGIAGLGSAFVMQTFSWQAYYPPARCTYYPVGAPQPGRGWLARQVELILSAGKFRLLLCYSYYNPKLRPDFADRWMDIQSAVFGTNANKTIEQFPFADHGDYTGWPMDRSGRTWVQILGTPQTTSMHNFQGTTTGGNYTIGVFQLQPALPISVNARYTIRTGDTSGLENGGLVTNCVNSLNYNAIHIEGTHVFVWRIIAGALVQIASAAITAKAANTLYWISVDIVGTTASIYVWIEGAAKPSSPTLVVTDARFGVAGTGGILSSVGTISTDLQFFDNYVVEAL